MITDVVDDQAAHYAHPMNIGVVAHVDAGKTSVSERLLFMSGAISKLGRVDSGSTQTDSLQQERERGITIKTAVASMQFGNARFNLIDTPGHSDFASEVQRSLSVLDVAILVVSACEGVQSRTRILARVLADINIPLIIFINKLDRNNADPVRVLKQLQSGLVKNAVMLSEFSNPGTK
ncbi:MAG: GTP-binding protein, partial [Gammaproteobacteria bacterium]